MESGKGVNRRVRARVEDPSGPDPTGGFGFRVGRWNGGEPGGRGRSGVNLGGKGGFRVKRGRKMWSPVSFGDFRWVPG